MRRKTTFISVYILITALLLSILAITNSNKTSINLFRWNTKDIRVGNLITISFLSGLAFSTLFTLNNIEINQKNKFKEYINKDQYRDDDDDDDDDDSEILNEPIDIERPPERDISESQPTISVNYRVINQNSRQVSSTESENNETDLRYIDDWHNEKREW